MRSPIRKAKAPSTLQRSGAKTKASKDLGTLNIAPNPHKIKRRVGTAWVRFNYIDKHGDSRIESLSGKTAKRFIHTWWKRQDGLTQASVPKGYTLKDYVYRFATDKKARYFLEYHRVWERNETTKYRRYWLATKITWLEEIGFPELRSHLKREE